MSFCIAGLLTACGGGGSGPVASIPAPEKPSISPNLIEWYGDSTSAGVDGTTLPRDHICPCTVVMAPAPVSFVPKVVNRSVGGMAAADLLHGSTSLGVLPWSTQMRNSRADVVVISVGINDSFSASLEDYRATLTELVREATQAGKRVILATENPTERPQVRTYMQTMRDVATSSGVALIDIEAWMDTKIGGDLYGHVPDGLHPNAATYKMMGEWLAAQPL